MSYSNAFKGHKDIFYINFYVLNFKRSIFLLSSGINYKFHTWWAFLIYILHCCLLSEIRRHSSALVQDSRWFRCATPLLNDITLKLGSNITHHYSDDWLRSSPSSCLLVTSSACIFGGRDLEWLERRWRKESRIYRLTNKKRRLLFQLPFPNPLQQIQKQLAP